ncbi:uncharacterized protein LOC110716759 [Chenopodium quinoa]|uniref:uncharacterized protein LOC110716759 n=1 Tax=Chenopodium quinoa TaxID=63459 RepID=UPI000B775F50|nr:uncharacterized protein LOC110716759 [Chenopodium quinoa]
MEFQEWKLDSRLIDIPFTGPTFTWTNGHNTGQPTFERLDKAYASQNWLLHHPEASLLHQPILFSDHAAIILRENKNSEGRKPYRIDNWCLLSKEVASIITLSWALDFSGSPMYTISRKLENLRSKLLKWCVTHRKLWGINWKELHESLSPLAQDLESKLHRHLFLSLREEKIRHSQTAYLYWKQRAKVKWDALGDSHSHLLFSHVQARRRKNAIWGLQDSSGPDGFSSAFFKSHWTVVGPSVINVVQYFFLHGHMLKDWNRTFIVLIPKTDHPQLPSQFRPIGLCNVLYKCIAKCLSSRLRQILPSLISNCQNAFVLGQLMSDNSLLAHEVLSYMNRSRGRSMSAALKLDMNKAYDRVNWQFLWQVLQWFGFPPYWIHIIQQCVSSVSYQILVNGNLTKVFHPRCGLRQGDPLSSYLFVLCMETILFCFYLDLPVDIGRSKCKAFQPLVDKITTRLTNFAPLHLSAAAKLVVINSVLVASINHVLSVFRIPSSIINKINNLLIRFWWKSSNQSNGLALTPSSILFCPKGMGGLGIRHLGCFNSALLAKQAWRIMHNPQVLLSQVLKAKYPALLLQNSRGRISTPSWGCRSILHGFQTLQLGLIWKIGNGSQVCILQDSWVPNSTVHFKESIAGSVLPTLVSSLLDPNSNDWDSTLIHTLFPPSIAAKILSLERPPRLMDDYVYWKFTKDGVLSTKSIYARLVSSSDWFPQTLPSIHPLHWRKIWALPILPKWKIFL